MPGVASRAVCVRVYVAQLMDILDARTASEPIIAMEINTTANPEQERGQRSRSRSQSPSDNRHSRMQITTAPGATREGTAPIEPTNILGVFGLHPRTTESELANLFSPFGTIKQTALVLDKRSGQSRGFGFVYFETVEAATEALSKTNGTLLDGRSIRVDYSATNGPHEATPGQYMGKRTFRGYGGYDDDRRRRDYPPMRRRSRSPPPYYGHHSRGGAGDRSMYRSRSRERYDHRGYYSGGNTRYNSPPRVGGYHRGDYPPPPPPPHRSYPPRDYSADYRQPDYQDRYDRPPPSSYPSHRLNNSSSYAHPPPAPPPPDHGAPPTAVPYNDYHSGGSGAQVRYHR